MASGRPVVAYGRGGALESMAGGTSGPLPAHPARVEGGILLPEQSVKPLMEGIKLLETEEFDPGSLRKRAERFDREVFKERVKGFIRSLLS